MKAALVVLALAVTAAAGAASRVEPARSGVAAEVAWVAKGPTCSPRRWPNQAVRRRKKIVVDDNARHKNWRLHAGSTVRTYKGGKGVICFEKGHWKCEVLPSTTLIVLPPGQKTVLLRLMLGKVGCSTPKRPEVKQFVLKGHLFTVGGQVEESLTRRSAAASSDAHRGGEVFTMAVAKAGVVVKVRSSTGVLAKATTTKEAVVVGRDQQAEAQTGAEPSPPTKIELTPAERAVFNELERGLPKETDVVDPTIDIQDKPPKPPKTSSVRTATFTFTASEQVVFSCALDDSDFRLCTSPYLTPRLNPGSHMFKIRATDVAGNIGTESYDWIVDGSRIAFESFRNGNPEIYSVDPDGVDSERLTNNTISDEHPDWSPDRKKIVFDRLLAQNLDIWVMNADGSGDIRLTTDPAIDRNPTWSPDGTRIAFESTRTGVAGPDGVTRDIYVMNADGSGVPRRLTTDPTDDIDPAWSPDSQRIVFASRRDGNFEIYVMNADGTGAQTRLTHDEGNDFGPSWSTDGRIAFHGLQGGPYANIFVLDPNGTITNVTKTEHNDTNPSWAPDGEHLVFSSDRDSTSIPPEPSEQQLYVLDLKTHEQTPITKPETRSSFGADW